MKQRRDTKSFKHEMIQKKWAPRNRPRARQGHARLLRRGKPDQARRGRGASASRAQRAPGTAREQATVERRETMFEQIKDIEQPYPVFLTSGIHRDMSPICYRQR